MIEIENLSIDQGRTPVLHNITATIPAGGIVAIIGPNGAGKSTLLHAMAGLIAPRGGAVRIDGTDMHTAREPDRAQLVALLTQSHGAVPRLSVRDLLGFGRWPHHRGRPGPEDEAAIAEALRLFDLTTLAGRDLDTLSGGQRQRAFVAMAYAQSTPWMFLDEPLAALDPKVAHEIMRCLSQIAHDARTPRTVILVLHDLSTALRFADWCLCLKAGQLHRAGPRAEALSEESLTALFDMPLRVRDVEGVPVVLA